MSSIPNIIAAGALGAWTSVAYVVALVFVFAGFVLQFLFKNRFKKFSKMPSMSGLSGAEIAKKMLHDFGITDVKIEVGQGTLTDHYNPVTKVVKLSPAVYEGRNVAAAAVAAHECGHAVQHAKAYAWLKPRSILVPMVSISSTILPWVLFGGIILLNTFPQLLLIGIILLTFSTLFSFLTLPVEFDASRRALAWLSSTGTSIGKDYQVASSALRWAASTYVIAALSSLATLVYYIMVYVSRQSEEE